MLKNLILKIPFGYVLRIEKFCCRLKKNHLPLIQLKQRSQNGIREGEGNWSGGWGLGKREREWKNGGLRGGKRNNKKLVSFSFACFCLW